MIIKGRGGHPIVLAKSISSSSFSMLPSFTARFAAKFASLEQCDRDIRKIGLVWSCNIL